MNNEDNKLVALTFDDGPSNVTEKVLDILERYHIKGTFFLIGQQVTEDKKDTLLRQLKLGCEIANHSWTHSDMSQMSAEEIKEEIARTSSVIEDMVGVTPCFFRPPYIALSDTMYEAIDLPFICGADSVDWDANTTEKEREENVIRKVTDGSLVLLHDLENNDKTLEALPNIIERLQADGYSFATASEIFKKKGIEPRVKHKLWSNVFE